MSELIADSLLFDYDNLSIQSTIQGGVSPTYEAWLTGGGVLFGDMTDTQPITEPGDADVGVLMSGVNSMLYGRVYIEPSLIDLGNLVSAETREFYVWNATFATITVDSSVLTGGDGVTLTEPDTPPYDIAPLQQVYYSASVSLTGPATVDASVTITVDGIDYTITIIGSRVVLWPFAPNWAAPVEEGIEFKTGILRAYSGREQRRSQRHKARRTLSYEYNVLRTDRTQYFDNILWGWQNRAFAVPLWQYKNRLTGPVTPGAVLVPVQTAANGFVVGQTAAFFRGINDHEVFEIESMDANSLVPATPIVASWPAGSLVFPLMVSVVQGNAPIQRRTSRVLEGRIAFQGVPTQTDPYLPVVAATDIYNGHEVLRSKPNWINGIDNSSDYARELVDFGEGAFDLFTTETLPTLTKQYSWLLKSRAAVLEFRKLLQRMQGMAVPVYVPSWHEDFTVSAQISSGASVVSCIDRGFFRMVGVHPARSHIMIRTKAHGDFLRPILTVGLTGGTINLGIGTALGVTLDPEDILQVHYLGLHRFASDKITLAWRSEQVAIINAPLLLVDQ